MNFYKFYSDIVNRIIAFNVACVTGDYELRNDDKSLNSKKMLQKIKELEEKKGHLKYTLKKETQFNKKVDINMKIKKIDKKIYKLEQKL